MMELGAIKKDFSNLLSQVQPWTLSHFVMWLDIKVAEYKVFGRMIMDNAPNDTPQWLRASADYLEQQQKEAQAQAAAQGEKDTPADPTATAMNGRTPLKTPLQQINSTYEPSAAFTTSAGTLYTVSTFNSTVVSPSASPEFSAAQTRPSSASDTFQKPSVPISVPDTYLKTSTGQLGLANTQRIPPISHLSPKHIRQSHIEQSLALALPAAGKDSLTAAEVESQIAVLESQIAAVNRSLKQSAQTGVLETAAPVTTTSKSNRRKADTSTDDPNAPVPPPYPKKNRQQSPVRAASTEGETTTLPPLHTSMDLLARMHRLDTDSIPESLRSQNIQSTLEAFEALRTQTFPPNPEAYRTDMTNDVDSIQSTAQDMSIHHGSAERDQMVAYVGMEREPSYTLDHREDTYTPTSDSTAAYPLSQQEVRVKVEAGQSDEDSIGEMNALKVIPPDVASHTEVATNSEMTGDEAYPVSMYASVANTPTNQDEKLAAELSTKKMRRKFLESMKNSNPKYYSHQIQQIIPFPDKFPVANLDYGLKALQMIQTGEITRAGKIQLIDTIFHELIKYTGLYPTPTQKMAVANAIVETFPTLAAKMKASHISPADSWYVILCDKFRNERRGLGGAGASPRAGKGKKDHGDAHHATMATPEHIVAIETDDSMMDMRSHELQAESGELVPAGGHSESPALLTAPYTDPTSQYSQQPVFSTNVPAPSAVNPPQMVAREGGGTVDMTSEEDEEDAVQPAPVADVDKLITAADRQKAKRAVRRKTHSPKRVQKGTPVEMPILDERYAASLLEYYSKHKPYYPTSEAELGQEMAKVSDETMSAVTNEALVQAAAGQVAVSQAIAQAVATHAVGGTDEPYSEEVAAIVQKVVSAHMDEVLAARNSQGLGLETSMMPVSSQPPEVEGTVEVKTSKKKAKPLAAQQKERTPEQQQVTLQRFKQKLAVTYPGVQAIDDSTLLCTCGSKVKLGRARMLHNYSNYHLKRCQNPPITARHEVQSPSLGVMSLHGLYSQGSPGELNIPTTGPKVIAKEMESVAFAGLSAADRETIQKHFLLNVPTPISDNTIVAGSTSSTPTQSLDLSMPVGGQTVLAVPGGADSDSLGHNGSNSSTPVASMTHSDPGGELNPTPDTTASSVLNVPIAASAHHQNAIDVNDIHASVDQTKLAGVSSDSMTLRGQSLDLSVQSSVASVLIEQQPGSELRVQIPSSIATSIAEYSGELPDLSAMNALALIQGKTDQPMETSDTNDQPCVTNEEPMNLAHS